jgi:hypothetical protein
MCFYALGVGRSFVTTITGDSDLYTALRVSRFSMSRWWIVTLLQILTIPVFKQTFQCPLCRAEFVTASSWAAMTRPPGCFHALDVGLGFVTIAGQIADESGFRFLCPRCRAGLVTALQIPHHGGLPRVSMPLGIGRAFDCDAEELQLEAALTHLVLCPQCQGTL